VSQRGGRSCKAQWIPGPRGAPGPDQDVAPGYDASTFYPFWF
jgi:hypothetical protein